MNPYLPPSTPPSKPAENREDQAISDVKVALRCGKCGSTNTSAEEALRSKPSVLAFMLFGWVFLLLRTAFSKQREFCHDCGAIRVYKTMGSKLAMAFLILMVLIAAINYLAGLQKS